jgi:hypothetical protein
MWIIEPEPTIAIGTTEREAAQAHCRRSAAAAL